MLLKVCKKDCYSGGIALPPCRCLGASDAEALCRSGTLQRVMQGRSEDVVRDL